MTGYRKSGYKCWWCWWGNEWAEVKTGRGPSERVTGQDGGGFYQLCALLMFVSRLPFAACLSVFHCSHMFIVSCIYFQVDLERVFFNKIFSKASGASVLFGALPVCRPDWFYWPVLPFPQMYWQLCVHWSISNRDLQNIQQCQMNPCKERTSYYIRINKLDVSSGILLNQSNFRSFIEPVLVRTTVTFLCLSVFRTKYITFFYPDVYLLFVTRCKFMRFHHYHNQQTLKCCNWVHVKLSLWIRFRHVSRMYGC